MATFSSPFVRSELRGYFRWDQGLTREFVKCNRWMHHACHHAHLKAFLKSEELWLRSTFTANLGRRGERTFEAVWLDLLPWHVKAGHNFNGPITLQIPLRWLEGRRFYVFQREINTNHHYYLVQRETTVALFGLRHKATKFNPQRLFVDEGEGLGFRSKSRYEIVLTEPAPLRNMKVIATDHRWCRTSACSIRDEEEALEDVREVAIGEVRKCVARFPQLCDDIPALVKAALRKKRKLVRDCKNK